MDPKTQKITCYFIDHGDEDLFGSEDLRELDPKFLDLAPQAKQVRLAHLEDWKDNEAITDLVNLVLGKAFWAQVHKKDENGVSLILWDTSTKKDININRLMIDKFVKLTKVSKMKIQRVSSYECVYERCQKLYRSLTWTFGKLFGGYSALVTTSCPINLINNCAHELLEITHLCATLQPVLMSCSWNCFCAITFCKPRTKK